MNGRADKGFTAAKISFGEKVAYFDSKEPVALYALTPYRYGR